MRMLRLYLFISTLFFFFSSRRRHTRFDCDWSSDVCSSDLELDHAVALRVLNAVGEHRRTGGFLRRLAERWLQVMTVEDVVAEYQCTGFAADEFLADDEGVRNPLRLGLHLITEIHAPTFAVTEQ